MMTSLTDNIKSGSLPRWLSATTACLLVLVLQNILIFWQHYIGTASFLNDFTRNIYPMIAFWTTLVQHGVFPEWTSYQAMGMPFVLTMQSGVFYPPLWLFAIFKIPFTLHMAAIVQVLHVLWGAIGCWMYMRLLGRSYGAALFAAIAFQFFGGFYSNSEHIDIIRAFSFIPWLFWAVHVAPAQQTLVGRHWLAPLMVMLFVTAAYQGNLVSHLFMLGVFWCLSLAFAACKNRYQWKLITSLHTKIAALVLLGILLSSVYLLPTIAVKSWLARDGVWTGQTMNWPLSYWNSLIMASNARGLYVLPSMLSGFITVPVFCLLFLISREFIKQNRLWVYMTIFALVMASGTQFFVYPWMIKIFPQLGTSRFPSSDYRGIFCFGLIILSGGLLDDFLNGKIRVKLKVRAALCSGLLIFFGLMNFTAIWLSGDSAADVVAFLKDNQSLAMIVWKILVFTTGRTISAEIVEWLIAIVLSSMVFVSLFYFRQHTIKALFMLMFLEVLSGLNFVNSLSIYWRSEVATDTFYQEVDRESPHTVMAIINDPLEVRPACHDMNLFSGSWRGYLLGDYMCQTQDSKTRPREVVNANAIINNYMRQAWQPRLIQPEQLSACNPDVVLQSNPVASQIHSLAYGLQQVDYQVNASDAFCFVENELMFAGWNGVISGSQQKIQPQAYCGALRSWCLPEGGYKFTTQYRAPWLREGAIFSLIFLMMYIALYFYWLRRLAK